MYKHLRKGTAWVAILLMLAGMDLWGPVQKIAEAASSVSEAILFSQGSAVYRMKPDGTSLEPVLTKLEAAPGRALPTRDGQELLSFITSGAKLSRSSLEGLPSTPVLDSTKPLQYFPHFAFSPDGTKLATTAKPTTGMFAAQRLYTSNADGTGAALVPVTGYTALAPMLHDWGTPGLLFTDQLKVGTAPNQTTYQPLYVVAATGGPAAALVPTTWYVHDAKYSPDASKIAIIASPTSNVNVRQLYFMNADGSGRTQIITNVKPSYLAWSPDSTQLAVTGILENEQGEFGVFKVPVAGGPAVRIYSASQMPENPENKTSHIFWGNVADLRVPTTLEAADATTFVGNTVTLTAKLTPALAGKTVDFSVSGTSVGSSTTDADGNVSISFLPSQSAGSYPVQATFAGDATTQPSTDSATLVLQPVPTGISVSAASATYLGSVSLTASLSPALAGRTLSFSVDGVTVGTAVTDGAGAATLSYTATQSVGTYPLTVSFAGETNYAASSGSSVLVISKAATSLVTSSITATYLGSATGQATLTPALSGRTLTFYVDGTAVASGTTDGTGTASATFSATQPGGTHALSVAFAGDANYQASGASATLTVNATAGSLAMANASAPFKSAALLSATLSPGVAGKAIAFTVGGTTVGFAATNASGTATFSYPGNGETAGTYAIGASFAGDASVTSASATATLAVTQAPGTLSVSPASGTYLGSTTLRATLSPAAAGKSISFSVGGVGAGSAATDASGVATLPYNITTGAGSHTISATWGGDADIAATSGTGTLTVSPAVGSIVVGSPTGNYGQTVTLTATLTPGVAGKSLLFRVGGTAVGSASTDGSGQASLSYTITQGAGSHTVTVSFAGDSDISSAAGSGNLTVNTAAGVLAVGPANGTFGSPVTLTATLSPAVGSRSIAFSVNGTAVGTGITNASGVATFTYTPALTVGSYSVGVSWSGDSYVGAATGTGTLTVGQATGVMTVATATATYYGSTTLSATLAPGTSGKTISFLVDGVPVGTGVTNGSGVATAPYSVTNSVGPHVITAVFAGDTEISAVSGTGTLTVNQAAGTLTVANSTGNFGGTATLRATLTPGVAGKTVNFLVGGVAAGSGVTDATGLATAPYTISRPVGTYPITASFAGDADIAAAGGAGTLTVQTATGTMVVANASGPYLSSTTLQATLSPAAAGKLVTFSVDGVAVGNGTTNAAGLVTLPYTITPSAGPHTLTAAFAGDADIAATTGSATLTVSQATGIMTVDNVSGNYLGTATLRATLLPAVAGKTVTFSVDGTSVGTGTTDATGLATFSYPVIKPVGSYPVTASFAGDANISAVSNGGTLTVQQATGLITVAPVTGEYQSTVSLAAALSPAEAGHVVTFSVNGTAVGTGTTDAAGIATYAYLVTQSVGTHTVGASFAGNTNISGASGSGNLVVTQATSVMVIGPTSGAYGSTITLTATLSPHVAGKTVTFLVDGSSVGTALALANGVATLSYTVTKTAGDYSLTAAFAGDTDMKAVSASSTLTVTPAAGTLVVGNPTGTYRGTATLTATLSPNLAGKLITFTVNGASAGSGTTDASGNVSVPYAVGLGVGTYDIVAAFAGDTQVGSTSGNGTLAVTQATGILTVSPASGNYKSAATLIATLTPADAGKTISFTVNGVAAGTGTTDASGVATFSYTIDLSVGSYPITATFAGDANVSSANGGAMLTVNQATGDVTVVNKTSVLGVLVVLEANLTPAVAGKQVGLSVNGVFVGNGITNAAGVATVGYIPLLSVGNYPITAAFAGDADISADSGTGSLAVTPATGSMVAADRSGTYMGTTALSATLSPALAGKTVTFSVDGTAVGTGTTDAAGLATYVYQIQVSAGTHTILASFAGDGDISAASDTAQLTVGQAAGDLTVNSPSTPVGQAVALTATLTPGVAGKVVTFSVDGTVVGTDDTDATGVATVSYTPLKSVGGYSITVAFAGDGDIAGDTGSGTLTVTQGTGTVTVTNRNGTYMGSVTLEAALSPALAGKSVAFEVDGVAVGSDDTDASGLATLVYTPITNGAGSHTITATFAGDADLTADSGTGTLTVTAATGVMVADDVAGNFGQAVELRATLTPGVAGKTVTFQVNGVPAGSDTTDGSGLATLSYTITNPAGNYVITASFAGDTDITAVSDTAQLVVTAAPGTLTVPNQSGIYMGSVTLTATLSPALAGKSIVFEVGGVAVGSDDTDGTGFASVTYTPVVNPVGSYQVRASFAGD
ncbi:MAG TPA: Ig-like domain repeat protein, partial [Symbiobacteriaceae bacterium]|nr:Ig-like domain repeat protein [Symbiobacteriaceae bacterium]